MERVALPPAPMEKSMRGSYGQFCPVAMAAEILCGRWTVVVLRELIAGSIRFNELRRGVPRMSPTLLSQRLKELEGAGILSRVPSKADGTIYEYHLTPAGRELQPLIEAFGMWGQRWVDSDLSLQNLDPQLLMWDMRRNLDVRPMPDRRSVVQFVFPELPRPQRSWWLIVDPESGVELCSVDFGFDVDLYAAADLHTMTAIWMGRDTVRAALTGERLVLTGDRDLSAAMQEWLGLSPFARVPQSAH